MRLFDIAFDAGYAAQESFTRAFSSAFGDPPARFRKAHRPVPQVPASYSAHFELDRESIAFQPANYTEQALQVEISRKEPLPVVYLRHIGSYAECGQAWGRLFQYAGPKGLLGPRMSMIGICHDDPDVVAEGRVRYDACMVLSGVTVVDEPFGCKEIPGGDYGSTIHKGPYDSLAATYASLMGEWLPQSGREPLPIPCLEIYLNDPTSMAPADLRTEVRVPLAPVAP